MKIKAEQLHIFLALRAQQLLCVGYDNAILLSATPPDKGVVKVVLQNKWGHFPTEYSCQEYLSVITK